jgi:hypothetical protein
MSPMTLIIVVLRDWSIVLSSTHKFREEQIVTAGPISETPGQFFFTAATDLVTFSIL